MLVVDLGGASGLHVPVAHRATVLTRLVLGDDAVGVVVSNLERVRVECRCGVRERDRVVSDCVRHDIVEEKQSMLVALIHSE